MIRIRSARQLAEIHRALRVGRNMSTDGLARRLNVSVKTIRDRENGTTGIPIPRLLEVAELFGLDLVLMPREQPSETPAGWRPTGTGWPA